MANWSRALLSLGEGLGQLAQSVGQRERDAMLAMREENLMRLSAQLREEGDVKDFGRQKELITMQEGMGERTEGRRQAFETGQSVRREQHDLTLAGREEGLQKERWEREDFQQFERSYAAQVDDIDDRLSKINDEITKQRAGASTSGMELDEAVLGPWQEEIEQLQTAKRQLSRQRDITLANMGAPGYEKISPEEARRLGASSGPTARNTAKREGRTDAAQAPASKGSAVPSPPPKPQGMIDRENRKARKVAAPGGATLGPVGRHFRDLDTSPQPPTGRGGPAPLHNFSTAQLREKLKTASTTESARIREELRKREGRR